MSAWKSHFVFSRGQRNGIFILALLIIALQFFYFLMGNSTQEVAPEDDIGHFQATIDSIKKSQSSRKDSVYPFNPNYISDYKGYSLGMSLEQIDKLKNFRKSGKWINSAQEFQQVTGVSDSLLRSMAGAFKFPEWVSKNNQNKVFTSFQPKNNNALGNLNTITAKELENINGIGEVLAGRIVKYRTKIGGFRADVQLKDVYGLNYTAINAILSKYRVTAQEKETKLNINSANILELAEIPYFNYELAREIVDYRTLHEKISSFEELSKIKDFPAHKIDRIQLYLTIN